MLRLHKRFKTLLFEDKMKKCLASVIVVVFVSMYGYVYI